jgi:hypothetical protein
MRLWKVVLPTSRSPGVSLLRGHARSGAWDEVVLLARRQPDRTPVDGPFTCADDSKLSAIFLTHEVTLGLMDAMTPADAEDPKPGRPRAGDSALHRPEDGEARARRSKRREAVTSRTGWADCRRPHTGAADGGPRDSRPTDVPPSIALRTSSDTGSRRGRCGIDLRTPEAFRAGHRPCEVLAPGRGSTARGRDPGTGRVVLYGTPEEAQPPTTARRTPNVMACGRLPAWCVSRDVGETRSRWLRRSGAGPGGWRWPVWRPIEERARRQRHGARGALFPARSASTGPDPSSASSSAMTDPPRCPRPRGARPVRSAGSRPGAARRATKAPAPGRSSCRR